MSVLVVKHHEEDSAGLVGEALSRRGASLRELLVPGPRPFPDPGAYERIVVLGAKWSVYDTATVGAFLDDELAFLRRADGAGVPVLGICFGAQLLCAAFDGEVEPSPRLELGWQDVEPLEKSPLEAGPWFQFHKDRCVLSDRARPLAVNDVCVQAFSIGAHVGVQFHPEVDGRELEAWYRAGCRDDVSAAGIDPEALLDETRRNEKDARRRADRLVATVVGDLS